LEAADAVCSGRGLDPIEILDLLAGLVNKSMVKTDRAKSGGMRYTMLEMIRQYGREKLAEAGEESWCNQQHVDYFLRFAETGDRELRGPASLEWKRRMEADYDNLRAALEWCFGEGQADEMGVRLANALNFYWHRASDYREAFYWTEKAAERSRSMPGMPVRAKALCYYGEMLANIFGKWAEAHPILDESLAAYRTLGAAYRADGALVMATIGNHIYRREQEVGNAALQEAVDILRGEEDFWLLGYALNLLAGRKFDEGDIKTAFALADECAASFWKSGDRCGVAISLAVLGRFKVAQGLYLEGQRYHEEALEVFREYGAKVFACLDLNGLGEAARGLDEYEEAEAAYRESLSMCQEMGAGSSRLFVPHINLGYTVLYRGDYEQAASFFGQALEVGKEMGRKEMLVGCLAGFAAVAAAQGKAETAARLFSSWMAQEQGLLREGETFNLEKLEPVDRKEIGYYLAICRAQLGAAGFDAAWNAGRGLSLEQAIEEALEAVNKKQ
jgi:tetratricopeptide (TPR) repeat protein